MTEKKNKAIITYINRYGEESVETIGYNTNFGFMETPKTIIFLLNEAPIKVLSIEKFIALDMEYEVNPDELPDNGDDPTNLVRFKN